MKRYSVAVVGATGLVGRTMLKVLAERHFPIAAMHLLASPRSVGQRISFRGGQIAVAPLTADAFRGVDLALFSAGGAVSKEMAPLAADQGCVVIDNSSAWRMDPVVPLVVPEVNADHLQHHSGIIANPNCSTIQMVVALAPLHRRYSIRRIVVATYQSVTGSGQSGIDQLRAEMAAQPVTAPAYPHPIAYNCLPHIDLFQNDGYTREEHKMINESRKILDAPALRISATCVRVPVLGGHSEAVNVTFEKAFRLPDVADILATAPGVSLMDVPAENIYPQPLLSEGRDEVFVGRLRSDPSDPHGLDLWIVSDNLRKGAATNAVQIAEALVALDPQLNQWRRGTHG